MVRWNLQALPSRSAVTLSVLQRGGSRLKYRRYKLYSSVQRADDIEVIVKATRDEPKFEYMQEIKLTNPRITATGYAINGRGYTDYILSADGIAKA